MSKRTEKEILADVQAAKEEYARLHTDKEKTTVAQVEAAGAKFKALVRELDEYVSAGARPCQCGHAPMGMLKTPAHSHNGIDLPNIWEVGCVHCDPVLVEREDGVALKIDGKVVKVKRRSFSARGFSPGEAIEKWNAGDLVEDFHFERMRGFTPEYTYAV